MGPKQFKSMAEDMHNYESERLDNGQWSDDKAQEDFSKEHVYNLKNMLANPTKLN